MNTVYTIYGLTDEFSQNRLAKLLKVSGITVFRWEAELRGIPKYLPILLDNMKGGE